VKIIYKVDFVSTVDSWKIEMGEETCRRRRTREKEGTQRDGGRRTA
jgi:hypothetical protein